MQTREQSESEFLINFNNRINFFIIQANLLEQHEAKFNQDKLQAFKTSLIDLKFHIAKLHKDAIEKNNVRVLNALQVYLACIENIVSLVGAKTLDEAAVKGAIHTLNWNTFTIKNQTRSPILHRCLEVAAGAIGGIVGMVLGTVFGIGSGISYSFEKGGIFGLVTMWPFGIIGAVAGFAMGTAKGISVGYEVVHRRLSQSTKIQNLTKQAFTYDKLKLFRKPIQEVGTVDIELQDRPRFKKTVIQ